MKEPQAGLDSQDLLFVRDIVSKIDFLVDTGAAVSVVPSSKFAHRRAIPEGSSLKAANGTPIKTFGVKLLKIRIGLGKEFLHVFQIADVEDAILGADFLRGNNISVDLA